MGYYKLYANAIRLEHLKDLYIYVLKHKFSIAGVEKIQLGYVVKLVKQPVQTGYHHCTFVLSPVPEE
ncbi:hypothetical protein LCGC14_1754670 [marine sediment metagenome]|uniref:Uncharacterized protein n=1 Tax=marine sediment metagenome TaxID=412755 RepID=A0A0F9JI10_9ZZZZ